MLKIRSNIYLESVSTFSKCMFIIKGKIYFLDLDSGLIYNACKLIYKGCKLNLGPSPGWRSREPGMFFSRVSQISLVFGKIWETIIFDLLTCSNEVWTSARKKNEFIQWKSKCTNMRISKIKKWMMQNFHIFEQTFFLLPFRTTALWYFGKRLYMLGTRRCCTTFHNWRSSVWDKYWKMKKCSWWVSKFVW